MSGRRIDDHSFFGGKGNDASVFPMGCKVEKFSEAKGAGELKRYEDSERDIRSQQDMNRAQAERHSQKPLHRN